MSNMFVISADLVSELHEYLSLQPWGEVAPIMQALGNLPGFRPVDEPAPPQNSEGSGRAPGAIEPAHNTRL